MIGIVKVSQFTYEVMMAHLFAMIGGKYDQGVLPNMVGLEIIKQATQLHVDLAHEAKVAGAKTRHLLVMRRSIMPSREHGR